MASEPTLSQNPLSIMMSRMSKFAMPSSTPLYHDAIKTVASSDDDSPPARSPNLPSMNNMPGNSAAAGKTVHPKLIFWLWVISVLNRPLTTYITEEHQWWGHCSLLCFLHPQSMSKYRKKNQYIAAIHAHFFMLPFFWAFFFINAASLKKKKHLLNCQKFIELPPSHIPAPLGAQTYRLTNPQVAWMTRGELGTRNNQRVSAIRP